MTLADFTSGFHIFSDINNINGNNSRRCCRDFFEGWWYQNGFCDRLNDEKLQYDYVIWSSSSWALLMMMLGNGEGNKWGCYCACASLVCLRYIHTTSWYDNDNQPHKKNSCTFFGGKRKCKDAFMHCYYVWYFYNNSILLSGSQSHTLKQTR